MENRNEKPQEKPKISALIKFLLDPDPQIYDKCSSFTKSNMKKMCNVLPFSMGVCGTILGISLSHFCFHDSLISYFITLPLSFGIYLTIDRMVVMADTRKNASFIRRSRFFIAGVFTLFNGFLIDSLVYRGDIDALTQKQIVAAQAIARHETDSLKAPHMIHREALLKQIDAGDARIDERNGSLVREVEGNSLSGLPGRGDVYQEKKARFERETESYARQRTILEQDVAREDSAIVEIERDGMQKINSAPSRIGSGFSHTLEAVHEIVLQSTSNMLLAIVFMCISLILEIIPMLAKQYIDVSEYFKLAQNETDVHLEIAEMQKKNRLEQVAYAHALENDRALHRENGNHQVILYQQKSIHTRSLLDAVHTHFGHFVTKQTEMQKEFPNHYSKHIHHLFDKILNMFKSNQIIAVNAAKPEDVEPEN